MSAETAREFEALEAQASLLLEVFKAAGYEPVAPAVIQPAHIFLDRIGEAIRNRTYVFTDPEGETLCLRPDLTVPVSRLYLERNPEARAKARYCYNGSAFRYRPESENGAAGREFRQAGIENYGAADPCKAEAEVLSIVLDALRRSGLKNFKLRFGDLGLFVALLDSLAIPERWRQRLKHHFWRPQPFQDLLYRLSDPASAVSAGIAHDLLPNLNTDEPKAAMDKVISYLDKNEIPHVGVRNIREITSRLLEQAADLEAYPLPAETVELINNYLAISGPPKAVGARIADLASAHKLDLSDGLNIYKRRLKAFANADIDLADAHFSAEFGRNLEYYTGFVFQVEIPELGLAGQIAGGGRYDTLISDIGSPRQVPAVGSAIHTERLLAVVGRAEAL